MLHPTGPSETLDAAETGIGELPAGPTWYLEHG